MRFLTTGLAIALVLIVAPLAVSQPDSTTQQMMDAITQKIQNITSYKVDIMTETQMMGQMASSKGEMAFKKPKKMHMTTTTEMMGGMKQDIYMVGDIVWTYMPMMNMAHKIDMSQIKDKLPKYGSGTSDSSDITNLFEGLPKDSIKYVEKKTVDGKEVQVFEALLPIEGQMPANQPGQQMMPKKMVMLIAADSGLPYRIMAYSQSDTLMMQQTYSNFRTNIPIDDSEFEFTPPEGVQVMDMTQGAINMMQQMEGSDTKVE